MGKVTDYWRTHPLFPIHRITGKISRDRYLELSMRYRVAPLGHASLWDRVSLISAHFQRVNNQIWKPGRDVAVDESICRFTGRAYEVTTVSNRPTPTGIKIWNIGQRGFLSSWVWHQPGKKGGPVGVKVPLELGGSKSGKGGNKTQAVVLHLLNQLLYARYHVYLDNLSTSHRLLEVIREHGYGATGTCRLNAGVISELVEIKKKDQKKDELPWGTLYSMPAPSGLVNQFGWKDMAFALIMTTIFEEDHKILTLRRRPKETSSSAKTARQSFNDTTKELEIPEVYHQYNYNMLGIDVADQLAGSNNGNRRIRRGPGKCLTNGFYLWY